MGQKVCQKVRQKIRQKIPQNIYAQKNVKLSLAFPQADGKLKN